MWVVAFHRPGDRLAAVNQADGDFLALSAGINCSPCFVAVVNVVDLSSSIGNLILKVEEILSGLGERRPRPGFLLPSKELHYDVLS